MGIFLLITTVLIIVALALVLPPMLGRGQKAVHDRGRLNAAIYRERLSELEEQRRDNLINEAELIRARDEIQRAALADLDPANETANETEKGAARGISAWRGTAAWFVALAIPAVCFALYFQWGRPDVFDGAGSMATARHGSAQSRDPAMPSLEKMVERLAERLKQAPDNPEGWLMLGRSYTIMGRLDEAGAAFAEAYRRQPDDPQILVSYAESLAGDNGGSMAGRPTELLRAALEVDPDFPGALWLAGIAAYRENRYFDAITHWERLQKGGKLSEREQEILEGTLADARQAAKEKGTQPPLDN